MKGKVTAILDGRSDGFKLVTVRKDGYDSRAFVREEFEIAVGNEVEFITEVHTS